MNAMHKYLHYRLYLLLLLIFSFGSVSSVLPEEQGKEYTYVVRKASGKPVINAEWDKKFWRKADTERLNNFMGKSLNIFPRLRCG